MKLGGKQMRMITGHHHISMVIKNAQENMTFYRDVLGLRLVKKTVNQDDPTMYHLFYGDKTGSPGTVITFFEMKQVGRTHRGSNAITKLGLLVETEATIDYFKNRFDMHHIPSELTTYRNKRVLQFTDPDGLELMLIDKGEDDVPEFWEKWDQSTVPTEHQIIGMGPVEMTVRRPKKLASVLTELFDYTLVDTMEGAQIFRSALENSASEIIVKELDAPTERPGRGSVHHLAIRVKNVEEMYEWEREIKERGFVSTGVIDRHYFHSFYFRDSNGIVFELATDGPGLAIDEEMATLGERITLPPFLEERREEIEHHLQPLT